MTIKQSRLARGMPIETVKLVTVDERPVAVTGKLFQRLVELVTE
jgi:hypothetical protein